MLWKFSLIDTECLEVFEGLFISLKISEMWPPSFIPLILTIKKLIDLSTWRSKDVTSSSSLHLTLHFPSLYWTQSALALLNPSLSSLSILHISDHQSPSQASLSCNQLLFFFFLYIKVLEGFGISPLPRPGHGPGFYKHLLGTYEIAYQRSPSNGRGDRIHDPRA